MANGESPRPILAVAEDIGDDATRVPLLGHANLWVEDSITDHRSEAFMQWCLQRAIEGTAPGQLEILVFDDELSGLAAPFEGINGAGERILQVLDGREDLGSALRNIRAQIQGVNSVIAGRADTLPQFRRDVDFPVDVYKIVMLAMDISTLEDDLRNDLVTLLRAGPRAGVSFLIHSSTIGIDMYFVELCDRYVVRDGDVVTPRGPLRWTPPDAESLLRTARETANGIATSALDPVPFEPSHRADSAWTASSANGVTFALGRHGTADLEITLGDELNQRHNMLVTGAVGQGKSNLLSVLTHSIALRYAPEEVQLHLLDFKEGVTLQRLVDVGDGGYLPHARVVGLEADREFGLGVLRHLFAVYRERLRLFKADGVQSLSAYRARRPDAVLPRIVLIVDEFHLLFAENDRVATEAAELLTRGVRLFRAAGIHVVLASQTIGGNLALMGSSGEGLFGQVPVRVALKNSLAESHATLGIKNDAAAFLRAREAVVNLDYGAPAANRRTAIAFADESVLEPLRITWWERARATAVPPYVFVGDRARSLADDARVLEEHRAAYLTGAAPVVLLGPTIEVDGPVLAPSFDRDVGRNIAIAGPGAVVPPLVSIVASLGAQLGEQLEVVVLHLLDGDPGWDAGLRALEDGGAVWGYRVRRVAASDAAVEVVKLAETLGAPGLRGSATTVLLAAGLDRWRSTPPEFADLVRRGPIDGVHVVGAWVKLDSFESQVGYGGAAYFDVKVSLGLDAQSTRRFVEDALLEWRPSDNRALVWDSARMVAPAPVIPYRVVNLPIGR